jgi:hypothetical protein
MTKEAKYRLHKIVPLPKGESVKHRSCTGTVPAENHIEYLLRLQPSQPRLLRRSGLSCGLRRAGSDILWQIRRPPFLGSSYDLLGTCVDRLVGGDSLVLGVLRVKAPPPSLNPAAISSAHSSMSSRRASSNLSSLRQRSALPIILLAWSCLSSATLPMSCGAGFGLWWSGPRRASFLLGSRQF